MSEMTAKDLVLAYVQAFNEGDFTRLRPLFTADAQIWGVLGYGDFDDVLPIWRELHQGLAMHLEVLGLVAEGDRVVARYRETGRFIGPFRGLAGHAPTGRGYDIVSMEWFEIEDSKIARRWGARDSATITRQVLG